MVFIAIVMLSGSWYEQRTTLNRRSIAGWVSSQTRDEQCWARDDTHRYPLDTKLRRNRSPKAGAPVKKRYHGDSYAKDWIRTYRLRFKRECSDVIVWRKGCIQYYWNMSKLSLFSKVADVIRLHHGLDTRLILKGVFDWLEHAYAKAACRGGGQGFFWRIFLRNVEVAFCATVAGLWSGVAAVFMCRSAR